MKEFIVQPAIEFEGSIPPPIPENISEDLARFYQVHVIEHASIYAPSARHMLLLAILKTGKTIGVCNFYVQPDGVTCELWGVAVEDGFKKNGTGKALLLRAISEATARGAKYFGIRWADPNALHVEPLQKAVFSFMASSLPDARVTYDAGLTWVHPGKGS